LSQILASEASPDDAAVDRIEIENVPTAGIILGIKK
jgi:hypothetical protein